MSASLNAALASCVVLGFRHGFDYDHIAAISDIAGVQDRPSDAMRLGLMYALGHAAIVASLGSAAIFFQLSLPHGLDRWAERAVGLTLVVLAIYVAGSLVRKQSRNLPRSRAAMIVTGYQWLRHRWRALGGRHDAPAFTPTPWNYNASAAFGIGVIHGMGAETPSQLALFLLTANLGGMRKGFWGLTMFLAGLLAMNTLMTGSAAGLFRVGAARPPVMRALAVITALYSFAIGVLFLWGASEFLPSLGG